MAELLAFLPLDRVVRAVPGSPVGYPSGWLGQGRECLWRPLTRTQAFIALALLKKVLPDLASVEVSGNPDKPLMVQVVRFSDGEQLEAPRPVIDVSLSKVIEMSDAETVAVEAEATASEAEAEAEAEATGKKAGRGRKSGHEWLGRRQRRVAERSR
jgi:hypothetical protein